MNNNLAIYFTHSIKPKENRGNQYHSFLSLVSITNAGGIMPIQELHFDKLGSDLLYAFAVQYKGVENDARNLDYRDKIPVQGDMWAHWFKIICLAMLVNQDPEGFISVADVQSGRATETMNCWDGGQAMVEIIAPEYKVTDHFHGVARGYHHLVAYINDNNLQNELPLASRDNIKFLKENPEQAMQLVVP